MSENNENERRASAAHAALLAHVVATGSQGKQSTEEDLIDLLTNLQHFATRENVSFRRVLKMTGWHWQEEFAEAKSYHGWTNYETWAVHLWLTNEQSPYYYWREQARTQLRNAQHDERVQDDTWTKAEAARFRLADQLREGIEDSAPTKQAAIYSDLLGAALSEVDWSEIAASLLSDAEEE